MTTPLLRNGVRIIFPLIFLFTNPSLKAQAEEYTYFYRVYFRDKGANIPSIFSPTDLLSQKAIDRRIKSGIEVPDYRDLPVFRNYLDQVSAMGFTLHCTSKWMNTALFKTKAEAGTAPLLALPFVSEVRIVKKPAGKSLFSDKLDIISAMAEPPPYDRPITMVNGYPLLNSGYNGTGILIAVLDGGFTYADNATSLALLRSRNGIKYTYDFVNNNRYVYNYHTHGTSVMSVLAGQIFQTIRGTACDADFLLLRTEDGATEFPVEEDFWAAGAEFADSAGADIISSSLGYCTFDDPLMNHKFAELDGNTTFITRAADIAASKGILVVNSAGNERNKAWLRIIAPSDGDSVLAAGAVDGYNIISAFSSAGPSADGQVKPDNAALGVSIVVQISATLFARSGGTSFSCPVLSGMAACLMEAVPEADNIEIINALHSSADRYNYPDSLYGYGIPDMNKALASLQDIHLIVPEDQSIVFPNPTQGEVEIVFRQPPGRIRIEVVTSAGNTIYSGNFNEYAGRNLILTALNNMEQGLYFIRLTTGTGIYTNKIVKLRDR
ncbi:MAG: S8 family peptidase [Bacteroidia bacterium]|nr:S8 family peptidase [Bacteroidia bacterium]